MVQDRAKDKVDSEEALAAREAVAALTGKPSAAVKPAPPAEPPQPAAPPRPRGPHDDLFDEDGNPYGVTTLDLSPRCPNCANELTSADALTCLHCGYNTQTAKLATAQKYNHHNRRHP